MSGCLRAYDYLTLFSVWPSISLQHIEYLCLENRNVRFQRKKSVWVSRRGFGQYCVNHPVSSYVLDLLSIIVFFF